MKLPDIIIDETDEFGPDDSPDYIRADVVWPIPDMSDRRGVIAISISNEAILKMAALLPTGEDNV